MPLQDKTRPDRKQKRRKVICTDTGQIFDSVQCFAEEFDITVQTAYNIIRRKQVFRGLTFRYYIDSSEQTGRTEQTNTNRNETEVHNHD